MDNLLLTPSIAWLDFLVDFKSWRGGHRDCAGYKLFWFLLLHRPWLKLTNLFVEFHVIISQYFIVGKDNFLLLTILIRPATNATVLNLLPASRAFDNCVLREIYLWQLLLRILEGIQGNSSCKKWILLVDYFRKSLSRVGILRRLPCLLKLNLSEEVGELEAGVVRIWIKTELRFACQIMLLDRYIATFHLRWCRLAPLCNWNLFFSFKFEFWHFVLLSWRAFNHGAAHGLTYFIRYFCCFGPGLLGGVSGYDELLFHIFIKLLLLLIGNFRCHQLVADLRPRLQDVRLNGSVSYEGTALPRHGLLWIAVAWFINHVAYSYLDWLVASDFVFHDLKNYNTF